MRTRMKSSRAADGADPSSALLASAGSAPIPTEPEDQDVGDVPAGVDEDELDHDEIDTDRIATSE